jgi:glycosyltransferase involved in cell wall biosynthesis
MNILQVTNTYYPEMQFGGPPLKIHALSKGLIQRGHRVCVLTFDSKRTTAREQRMLDGVKVQYLPWIGFGLRQWPTKRFLMARAILEADIVHCYGLYNLLCPAAIALAHKRKRPVLIEPLGMYRPRARNQFAKRLYHRWFTRRMFQRAACVVTTSPAEHDELKVAVGSTKLVLRRNGIDVEAFRELPSEDGFRSKFNLSSGDRVILYLGRISPIKNLEELVRAFARAALANCKLVLAGPESEPNYAAKLRDTIHSLELEGKVIWAGPLFDEDKLSALAAAELLVLPSLSESFGNAAAEAVAAGLPVLLTDTCGIAPMIHGRAGMAVPLGEASLARGLQVMMNDAGQRATLTRQREEVIKELSWEEPLNQTEKLYEEILASHTELID